MAYLDKTKLVNYMMQKHAEINGYTMSPIKVQKTLYYLYALWGGNVRLLNNDLSSGDKICEQDIALDEDLFEPAFEAWKYGPVDTEIYWSYKGNLLSGKCSAEELLEDHQDMGNQLLPFIDHIIEQTSEISDFTLVDMTHDDDCWKDAYELGRGSGRIDKERIKDEHARKLKED